MPSRTYVLTGGAFAVGTSAYVVSGVLTSVSARLGVSLSAAGQLATVFALSYALSAPVLATLTGRWERRSLLLAALVVAAAGNAVTAMATGYPLVLAGRVLAAFGAAVYTPAATLVATGLLPAAERGRAVARVFGGLTLAMALGVPAGSLLAGHLGYRGVFALVAATCLLLAGALRAGLPRVPAPPSPRLRERLAVAADRRVQTVLAVTVLAMLAAMSVYIYVVPLLGATAGVHGAGVGMLLLVYGLGALLGNAVGGLATDRFGSVRALLVITAGSAAAVGTLPLSMITIPGAVGALLAWSVLTWSFNPPLQNLLLDIAPTGGLVLSLNASAIYLGAGLSGVLGGLVIATLGVRLLPAVAAVLALAAFALVGLLALARVATASSSCETEPAG